MKRAAQNLCKLRIEYVVFMSRTVFVLEHFFASKLFTALREARRNACLEKELPNKAIIHRLLTHSRDIGSVSV
jgi:hypothetical protein